MPAFEVVYAEHFDYVWRTTRRLGVRPGEVADVVQDVFLAVHTLLPKYEPRNAIRGWLYAIVARTVLHHHRTRRRRTAPGENELDEALVEGFADADARGPEDSVAESEHLRLLERLLDSLDPEKRVVLVLAAFEHKSMAEIAAILDLNPNTVATRLRAARERIQAALARHHARDGWRIK
ncbi:RNA polymerase sigma factor RpoE [Labilithrix luteola]|uniref:RNA polymerase sigma factor RpoE n=1 Tax=Labilithrix luteola TaxID=1391654 RepID=A0A0K1Q3T4_9BACT|nr:RNA polymerase sigma factor RpoE [Labilithrix luteola]